MQQRDTRASLGRELGVGDVIGLVWNPSKVEEDELRTALSEAVSETGFTPDEVRWFATTVENPGQDAAGEAMLAGCTVIVAAGGDGTVRAVVERLTADEGGPEFGIIPLGTGNLFARNLDVPLNDPQKAFVRVLERRARPIDIGELVLERESGSERHTFTVMAGFGIDAQMIAETDDELKARAGWLAYVESLGRAFQNSAPVDLVISVDDGDDVQDRGHTLLIANCGTLQGGAALLPDALIDDGLLDLMLLRAEGVVDWLDTLRNLVWDNGIMRKVRREETEAQSSDSIHLHQAKSAKVTLTRPVLFEIDGEEIGEVTGFTAKVLPGALRMR
ncbi:diacylglycerol/lipid kinase family protein [Leucobacter sp. W1478]|uniref:diacylglycerol/lipid kinase family protein n=1 Tax=Leucobacter sp. W1478 TaxID=3439065 RepID=UPI003F414D8A